MAETKSLYSKAQLRLVMIQLLSASLSGYKLCKYLFKPQTFDNSVDNCGNFFQGALNRSGMPQLHSWSKKPEAKLSKQVCRLGNKSSQLKFDHMDQVELLRELIFPAIHNSSALVSITALEADNFSLYSKSAATFVCTPADNVIVQWCMYSSNLFSGHNMQVGSKQGTKEATIISRNCLKNKGHWRKSQGSCQSHYSTRYWMAWGATQ